MNLAEPIARFERVVGWLEVDGYRPEYARQVYQLARAGFELDGIADFFEVDTETLEGWQARRPEFTEALADGTAAADDDVATALYRTAVGYERPAVHVASWHGRTTLTEYTVHVPPDVRACIFWLERRRPDEWGGEEVVRAGTGLVHVALSIRP